MEASCPIDLLAPCEGRRPLFKCQAEDNSNRISWPWQAGSVAAIALPSGLTARRVCQSPWMQARQSQAGGRNGQDGLEVTAQ